MFDLTQLDEFVRFSFLIGKGLLELDNISWKLKEEKEEFTVKYILEDRCIIINNLIIENLKQKTYKEKHYVYGFVFAKILSEMYRVYLLDNNQNRVGDIYLDAEVLAFEQAALWLFLHNTDEEIVCNKKITKELKLKALDLYNEYKDKFEGE